jgi:hypothetical protein
MSLKPLHKFAERLDPLGPGQGRPGTNHDVTYVLQFACSQIEGLLPIRATLRGCAVRNKKIPEVTERVAIIPWRACLKLCAYDFM